MKASILIPVFNREKTIGRTLLSASRHDNVSEIIVVDDCSTDGTAEVIHSFKLTNLIYIKLKQKGNGNVARNVAAQSATGDVLMFLDSDDEFCAGRVTKVLDYFNANRNDIVLDAFITENKGNKTAFEFKNLDLNKQNIFYGLVCNAVPLTFSSISVTRECFFRLGGLDELTLRHQDRDFLFTAISNGNSIHVRNSLDIIKHQSGDSFSRSAAGYMATLEWIAQKHKIFEDPEIYNVKKYLIIRSLIGSLLKFEFIMFLKNLYFYKQSKALGDNGGLKLSEYFKGKRERRKFEASFIKKIEPHLL
jgi:glycosyltransferase involved in cell wall biosynthesis